MIDSPELREGIAKLMLSYTDRHYVVGTALARLWLERADELLALIPDIEEALKQRNAEWQERLKQEILGNEVAQVANIKEAKKQERERILKEIEEYGWLYEYGMADIEFRDNSWVFIIHNDDWQALKGE